MARLPRLYIPGLPSHVRVRGNDKQAIVRTEGDRIFLHRCLVDACGRHELAVHAYVFMDNHFHLLATGLRPDSLPRAMQCLGRRYVSYFNYLHGRTGTLWEGRYRSSPVETERYFMTCQRYVEENPVRAGMVANPIEHAWSSHRCNLGLAADDLVTPHALYLGLGRLPDERYRYYADLFRSPLGAAVIDAIRAATDKGMALGGPEFCKLLASAAGRRASPGQRGRPAKRENAESAGIGVMGV